MNDGPYRDASEREPDEPPLDPRGPWVLQTWVSQRSCPNCAVSLFAARQEGFRIDACGTCGGAWLDHTTTQRAIEERSLVPATLSEQASAHAGRNDAAPARQCPSCSIRLTPTFVPEARVVIDVCATHGAWFDPDELRRVIEGIVRTQPSKLDPEVDREIARAARLGVLRPPENYKPSGGIAGSLLEVLVINLRDRK